VSASLLSPELPLPFKGRRLDGEPLLLLSSVRVAVLPFWGSAGCGLEFCVAGAWTGLGGECRKETERLAGGRRELESEAWRGWVVGAALLCW